MCRIDFLSRRPDFTDSEKVSGKRQNEKRHYRNGRADIVFRVEDTKTRLSMCHGPIAGKIGSCTISSKEGQLLAFEWRHWVLKVL